MTRAQARDNVTTVIILFVSSGPWVGRDNQGVHKGDVLFRPTMRRLALGSTNPCTALGSVFATCARDWVTVRSVFTSDIAGKYEDTRVALDVEAKYKPIESLTLFVRPGITSADGVYGGTLFAINAARSTFAGVPQSTAGGGINAFRFSVGAAYRLNRSGASGACATAVCSQGDATNSPITKDKSQNA